ncbi:recombinase family protein [Spirosoma sp. HMF4905]|uniref:Recombinase family protein n=1 Tax=Spirosoma arboris TaxID=2682092 RepID=A0A7K1SFU6_9BACT|nr:recombinase family protein [Spirosoma arboris]MVM32436.1 recombinase family protein [Spirosoma arboris]
MSRKIVVLSQRPTTATKAVILTRVSSKEQEEGYSIEAQKHRLQLYCERRSLTVLKIFELVESSTQGDRKQFMAMLKFVKSHREPIAIVADKVDRVQRSFKEYPMLDALIQAGKIELHFNSENYIIHKNSVSQERLMWSMGVIMAQSYVDSLRDNVKRSIDHKIRQGEWIALAPIGYLNVKDNRGRGDVVVDPDRALLIRRIFETYATGASTLEEIRLQAIAWSLKNRVGKKGNLTRSQIHQIITNPFYYGRMMIKGKLYDHRYPPLISKNLFDQCQAVLQGWHKKPFQWAGKEYVFRGLLTCATTGRVVTADTKKKTYVSGETAQWTYLRCGDPENPEKLMWVREEEILEQVEQILKRLTIPAETLEKVLAYIRETDQVERVFLRRQMGELQREHAMLQNRLDTLMDLLLDGTIDRHDFETKKSRLREQQVAIETHISANREGDDSFKNALISLVSLSSQAHELFTVSTIEQKRKILNFVFANLSLNGRSLCYCFRKPFDLFVNCTNLEDWRSLVDSLRTDPEIRVSIDDIPVKFCFTNLVSN